MLSRLLSEYYGNGELTRDKYGYKFGSIYINQDIPNILTPYEINQFGLKRSNNPILEFNDWYNLTLDDILNVFSFVINENHNVGEIVYAPKIGKGGTKVFLKIKKSWRKVRKVFSTSGESWCFQVFRVYTCELIDKSLVEYGYNETYQLSDTDCLICNW